MTVENITNYLRVTDRISSSGQPQENEFRAISSAGFAAIINLAMPDSDNAIPEEGSIVTELGMSCHHIPVPFDAPKSNHLKQFFGLMDSLQGQKVWVHCVVNYRASAFLYLYRRWKGMSEDEAQMAMFKNWTPNAMWLAFMAQPIDQLGYSTCESVEKPHD